MDRRKCDRDMISKMYDLIELIYALNRLSKDEEDIMENIRYPRCTCDKYRGKPECRYDCPYYKTKDSFIDKIIFYLKSLNEG